MAVYTADFETTTDVDDCRVWAWGVCSIDDPDELVEGTGIDGYLAWTMAHPGEQWFHNLAFDGEFIVNRLLHDGWEWVPKSPGRRQFTTLISNSGKWYQVEICFDKRGRRRNVTYLKDSYKKLTMGVDAVAQAFDLPISKLSIDYTAPRPVGHVLTAEEREYLANDVRIMALALHEDFGRGLTRLTTGADALASYKEMLGRRWDRLFPVLPLEVDNRIRLAYKGGWTYCNPLHQATPDRPHHIVGAGLVYDKNSMYPSMMYDRPLPIGVPRWFDGELEHDPAYPLSIQYATITARLKDGMLPTLQVKNSPYYAEHEYLIETDGVIDVALTNIDWELLVTHYDVEVVSYNGGYQFRAMRGMFREYIDYWMREKATTTGGRRLRAKLMLNALYGKFATNPDVTQKRPYLKADGSTGYALCDTEYRDPVYTPMGAFITAWARQDIITNAQALGDRFAYADTDSLHVVGTEPVTTLDVHPTDLGKWALEGEFTRARYIRSKTYLEEIGGELEVKCAGCPKDLTGQITFANFEKGLTLWGKLRPRHVMGGIVLEPGPYSIK